MQTESEEVMLIYARVVKVRAMLSATGVGVGKLV
jgi:hypothetical protein